MSLKTLGALLSGPAQGDPSLPQGGQGLLPYPIQGGLILSQGARVYYLIPYRGA